MISGCGGWQISGATVPVWIGPAYRRSLAARRSQTAHSLPAALHLNRAIQGCIIFLFAPLAGVHPSILALVASIGVMLLTGFGLTAVGLLFPARMISFEGFGTVNNFIILPLYFASGAQFPLDRAPRWLQLLALGNPLAYAVDLLRGLLVGLWSHDPRLDLLVLVGFAVAALIAATYAFTRQE